MSSGFNDSKLSTDCRERPHGEIELLRRVRRRQLNADAGLALRDHRETEPDDVDAAFEQLVSHFRGEGRVAEHHRQDRMLARLDREAGRFEAGTQGLGRWRAGGRAGLLLVDTSSSALLAAQTIGGGTALEKR